MIWILYLRKKSWKTQPTKKMNMQMEVLKLGQKNLLPLKENRYMKHCLREVIVEN
uniref:Uncharacterized protein n=1 Tax=Setaria viridis TaxID=4556 RepID=A0A4U6VDK7_SETVI|nr:hypothetical protein SEVIR_4G208401v2 [Setaria viridis]